MVKILNIASIIIGIIGTYFMYYYSPKMNSQVYIYRDEEIREIRKRDIFKNKMVRLGMFLLCTSFLLQLVIALIAF